MKLLVQFDALNGYFVVIILAEIVFICIFWCFNFHMVV